MTKHFSHMEAVTHILHTIENSDFCKPSTTSAIIPGLILQTKAILNDPDVDHAADFAIGVIRDAIHEIYYNDPLSKTFYQSRYERSNDTHEPDRNEI